MIAFDFSTLTTFEASLLIVGVTTVAVSLFVGLLQIRVVTNGIRAMQDMGAIRSKEQDQRHKEAMEAMDRAKDARDQRHKEAMEAMDRAKDAGDQRHKEAMEAMDRAKDAGDQRHKEAMEAMDRNHAQAMAALQELIRRTAPTSRDQEARSENDENVSP